MSYFALVNPSTNVIETISVANENWSAENWIKITGDRQAVKGGTYVDGVFIMPQPYPSWSLNSNKDWQAPVTKPTLTSEEEAAEKYYEWDESSTSWVIGTYEEHHA